jgi:hypothetical protein
MGGNKVIKPALRLMTDYRLVIEFSPRFERNLRRVHFLGDSVITLRTGIVPPRQRMIP